MRKRRSRGKLPSGNARWPKDNARRRSAKSDKPTKFSFLPIVRPHGAKEVKYQLLTDNLAMPILAALRVIVSDDATEAQWLEDPYTFLDIAGPTLVDSLTSAIQSYRGQTSVVLKSKDVWKNLYVQAKTVAYELGILQVRARSK